MALSMISSWAPVGRAPPELGRHRAPPEQVTSGADVLGVDLPAHPRIQGPQQQEQLVLVVPLAAPPGCCGPLPPGPLLV